MISGRASEADAGSGPAGGSAGLVGLTGPTRLEHRQQVAAGRDEFPQPLRTG